MVPSSAVTSTVIGLAPTTSGIEALAVPDATGVPFTLTVEVASVIVGVIATPVVALATLEV